MELAVGYLLLLAITAPGGSAQANCFNLEFFACAGSVMGTSTTGQGCCDQGFLAFEEASVDICTPCPQNGVCSSTTTCSEPFDASRVQSNIQCCITGRVAYTNYQGQCVQCPIVSDGCFPQSGCGGASISLSSSGAAAQARECCVSTTEAMSYSLLGKCLECTDLTIQCPPLPEIANGRISYSPDMTPNYTLSTNATYSCDEGFFLDVSMGDEVRTCEDDDGMDAVGRFSGKAPLCVPADPILIYLLIIAGVVFGGLIAAILVTIAAVCVRCNHGRSCCPCFTNVTRSNNTNPTYANPDRELTQLPDEKMVSDLRDYDYPDNMESISSSMTKNEAYGVISSHLHMTQNLAHCEVSAVGRTAEATVHSTQDGLDPTVRTNTAYGKLTEPRIKEAAYDYARNPDSAVLDPPTAQNPAYGDITTTAGDNQDDYYVNEGLGGAAEVRMTSNEAYTGVRQPGQDNEHSITTKENEA